MGRRIVLVPFLILLNVGVFMLWQAAKLDHFTSLEWMVDNFTVSFDGLAAGRWWTLITSVFSHNWFLHLLINLLVLRSFGSLLERVLGPWRLLRIYLFCGVVASLCHCLVSAWVLGEPNLPAVGASGAIAGMVLLFSLMFPRETILLFGVIPLPAMVGAVLFIGLDLWGLSRQAGGGGLPIGHGAHLGGAFAGIAYYVFALRRKWRAARSRYLL